MNDPSNHAEETDLVRRPKDQLLTLPFAARWEVTRRHPYYLGLWRHVADSFHKFEEMNDEQRRFCFAAKLALGAIGVFGEPIPPETPFEQISGEDPAFLAGSLQPITVRAIATFLLGSLSPETKQYVGETLIRSAQNQFDTSLTEEERKAREVGIVTGFSLASLPELDGISDQPLFLMHLGASQETIREDANRQAKLWKQRLKKGSPKVHSKRLVEYLEVWDRIEGWNGNGYSVTREAKFNAISKESKKSISTLHDQFRAAFRLIVGHDFSPELWWKLMGPMKLAHWKQSPEGAFAWLARRKLQRADDRLVSESGLFGRRKQVDFPSPIQSVSTKDDAVDVNDLVNSIMSGIKNGLSDEEIFAGCRLIHKESWEMVGYFRKKLAQLETLG